MDVDVGLLEHRRLDAEGQRAAADIGSGGGDGLLHHLLQVAGHGHATTARHLDRLDGQDVAAELSPGQTGDDADLIFGIRLAIAELLHARILGQLGRIDGDGDGLGLGHLAHRLAGQSAQGAFQ
ncbi:hypothetical protein D3C80_1865150 [compost metagenome]